MPLHNEILQIEEIFIKPLRKFVFTNRISNLKLCVSNLKATIDSCVLNNQEIIVKQLTENEENNEAVFGSMWNSHVYGFEKLELCGGTSAASVQTKINYQLTNDNMIIIEGHSVFHPFFFNLNSVNDKPSLDGHYLRVRSSHESINVFTDSNSVFSQFINNVPLLIADYLEGSDFVYSANANASALPNAAIIATLSYNGKSVDIRLDIEQWTASHLRVKIQNGSIAFIPHNMSRFKITYKFSWQ